MNKPLPCLLVFLLALFYDFTALAQNLKLANVLQSNMVVQQAKPFRVWGTAKALDPVSVTADWLNTPVIVTAGTDGKWIAQIDVPAAVPGNFTQHTITVKNTATTITLTNILIGDVWFCAGQSNMDMPVNNLSFIGYKGVTNYEQEIAAANFPNLRYYESEAAFKVQPVDDTKGTWQICTPQSVKDFSAVAYFFGRELHLKTNIPIGLVVSAAPGASCQAFVPQQTLETNPVLRSKYLDPHRKTIQIQSDVDKLDFFGKVTQPTLLYNGVVHPFINLSVKGYTWYQGESNNKSGSLYTALCGAMIKSWRQLFNQGDLPFYFVQIAPVENGNKTHIAFFREAQEDLLKIPNTGMAVSMDVGELKDIHPRNKRPVGERLAKNALYKTYGQKSVAYLGPTYKSFTVSQDTVKIIFTDESVASGLNTNDSAAPKHFYVAGADRVFYPARAAIVGKQVWVLSDKVKKPVALRYAFIDDVITNLQNKEGLPAAPFRTDRYEYTLCSFAYGHYAGITTNCNNCKISTGVSAADVDTATASIATITTTPGAHIDQNLQYQHPGIAGDKIILSISTPVALNNTALTDKIELVLYKGETVTAKAFLGNPAIQMNHVGNNRYKISFITPGEYDRLCVRFHSGGAGLTSLNLYYSVQEFAQPLFADSYPTICANNTALLKVNGNDTYNWYETPVGGLPVFTGNEFITPRLTANKTYYVQNTRNYCETPERAAITVNVVEAPVTPIVIVNKVTRGEKAILRIHDPQDGHTYKWYTSSSSINPVFTGAVLETPAIMVDTAVYVEAEAGNCVSERIRAAIKLKQNPDDSINVVIYPNPTAGEINFLFSKHYNKPFTASVINMQGRTMYSANATVSSHLNQYKIWLSQLPDGMYILNVKGSDFERSLKIIISK